MKFARAFSLIIIIRILKRLASNLRQKPFLLSTKNSKTLEMQGLFDLWDYSHSLLKSISGISKWRIGPVCSLFRPQNVPFSLLSHQSRRACPHFDLTICPHTMAKAEGLEEYYYFGIMRTVSGVSQVAFEWAYFSLAEVSYYRQMFRLACRRYLL